MIVQTKIYIKLNFMIINNRNSQMLKPIKHLCAKELDWFSTNVITVAHYYVC